ncbi:MAG: acyltransferase [Lachnospiraceae bacterium]|nr:acyltransferase [Lachnospiraceae bacterium]
MISGFLFIKGNRKELENKSFAPIKFIISRISIFWPMIAIGGMLVLIIGYFNMLPDNYENLAQSIIASNVFLNNVLQAITTKNYWDVVNIYKPLMHTWYVSVLLQSFVFLAIVLWIASKISKKDRTRNILIILSLISFILYISPIFLCLINFTIFLLDFLRLQCEA